MSKMSKMSQVEYVKEMSEIYDSLQFINMSTYQEMHLNSILQLLTKPNKILQDHVIKDVRERKAALDKFINELTENENNKNKKTSVFTYNRQWKSDELTAKLTALMRETVNCVQEKFDQFNKFVQTQIRSYMNKNILNLIEASNHTEDIEKIKYKIELFQRGQPSDFDSLINKTDESLLRQSEKNELISRRQVFDEFIRILLPDKQALFKNKRYWIADDFKTELQMFTIEFNRFSEKPSIEKSLKERSLTIKSHFIKMSDILPYINNSDMRNLASVNIYVTHSFLFDTDYAINSLHATVNEAFDEFAITYKAYERHAPDFVIISPKVIFDKPITVDLSCATEPGHPNNKTKADDGQGAGANGSDGESGLPGYNGGSLYILADSIQNREQLRFISKRGKGGPGQNGTGEI